MEISFIRRKYLCFLPELRLPARHDAYDLCSPDFAQEPHLTRYASPMGERHAEAD